MIKVFQRIIIALAVCSTLVRPPLHATQISSIQACEGISATLAATGSYLEHALNPDDSQKSNFIRLLVSMIRVIHNGLVLCNHPTDYNPYHSAWLAADIAHSIGRTEILTRLSNESFEEEGIIQKGSISPEIEKKLNTISNIILPLVEAISGLIITFWNDETQQAKKFRFIAQSIISLARLKQNILHSEGVGKKSLIGLLILHYGHVLYQLFHENSGFNTWIMTPRELSLSKEELRTILNKRTGGITCVRGHYLHKHTKAEIAELEKELEKTLTLRGFQFIKADGHYNGGHIPNSYIILDIGEEEIVALANRFAQASVITFDKGAARLLPLREFAHNQVGVGVTWEEILDERLNYTLVQTIDGEFKFTYDFNFDSN